MTEYLAELPKLVQNLSPKFYVALTGTSSFLSGTSSLSNFLFLNHIFRPDFDIWMVVFQAKWPKFYRATKSDSSGALD